MKPTDEEKRNGWDSATLTKYLSGRQESQDLAIDVNSPQRRRDRRPTVQNHHYRVHRWRE